MNAQSFQTVSDPSKLRVPQSTPHKTSAQSIMDAYNTQSKIQLYDESSAMSSNEIDGVKGRDIPLSALRPKAVVTEEVDEYGNPVQKISKSRYAEEEEARKNILKAYNKMKGVEEDVEDEINLVDDENGIDYIEDVPDDNEGILEYLRTCIVNQEKNLEMLKSLYAALNG